MSEISEITSLLRANHPPSAHLLAYDSTRPLHRFQRLGLADATEAPHLLPRHQERGRFTTPGIPLCFSLTVPYTPPPRNRCCGLKFANADIGADEESLPPSLGYFSKEARPCSTHHGAALVASHAPPALSSNTLLLLSLRCSATKPPLLEKDTSNGQITLHLHFPPWRISPFCYGRNPHLSVYLLDTTDLSEPSACVPFFIVPTSAGDI